MSCKLNTSIIISLLCVLFFLTSTAIADYSQDSIYYFTKYDGDSLEILEIWSSKPDIDEIKNLGYKLVTYEDIHNDGYLTPSESEAEAKLYGEIDEGNEDGYGYSSWINPRTSGNTKYIDAGSSTSRPWYAPGSLWLCCTLYVTISGGSQMISGTYGPYQTWGYRTYYSFPRSYPSAQTRLWRQKGWHHWGNPLDKTSSQVIRTY